MRQDSIAGMIALHAEGPIASGPASRACARAAEQMSSTAVAVDVATRIRDFPQADKDRP